MSPLLNTRPSEQVTYRLLAACLVMAALAIVIAISAGDYGRPSGASPAFLGAGAVCAALVAYLLTASARAVGDPKLRWMAAGSAIACAGLMLSLLGQPTIFPAGGLIEQSADAAAARYLIWHAGLAAAAVLAVAGARPTRERLTALIVPSALLLAWSSVAEAPLGDLVGLDNEYTGLLKLLVAVIVLLTAGAAIAWWRATDGTPAWGAMCMIAALGLSAGDGLAYLFAPQAYSDAWWASLTLRAGQFAIPSVGLVMGFVGLADKLRELQDEIGANFAAESERAAREEELAGRRPRAPRAARRAHPAADRRRGPRRGAAADRRPGQRRGRRRRGARALHGRRRGADPDRVAASSTPTRSTSAASSSSRRCGSRSPPTTACRRASTWR